MPVNTTPAETNLPEDAPLDEVIDAGVREETVRISRSRLILRRFWRPVATKVGVVGFGFIVLVALLGPYIAQWDFAEVDNTSFLMPPSAEHWLGTTQGGRDIFAMTVEGLRKSLIIGVCVAFIQTFLAATIGATAAYFGKTIGKVILWVVDLMLVIPSFLLIAIISQKTAASKGSIAFFIILLSAFGWMLSSRVVRAMTLSVVSLDYVNAAKFMSVPAPVIIFRHIIPNISSYLIIDFTLGMAAAVLAETSLSFFGFGVLPPNTSLGTLIGEGAPMATTFPYVFAAPATLLVIMLLSVNLLGDSLRDAIDPSSSAGGKA